MENKHFAAVRNSPVVREALRVAPVRPNFAAGLRAGLATTLPLLLIAATGRPELLWTSMAGFNSVLVDKGGAYRTRAGSIGSLALAGSLSVLLGTLAATHPWATIPLVLATVFACAFVRMFGAEASSVGICTSVVLVVALSRPAPDFASALSGASFFLIGSVWAGFLSLVLWPLRPYRPAARAVAAALRELGKVANSFIGASMESLSQVRRRELLGHAREAIELARTALGTSRRGKSGPSRRGEQLLALLEAADLLFAALVALEDGLALATPDTLPMLPSWIDASAKQIASELARVADAIAEEHAPTPRPAARPSFTQIAHALEPHLQVQSEHVPRVLARALERLDFVTDLAQLVGRTRGHVMVGGVARVRRTEPADLSTGASKLSLLRDHLTLDSAMFRHALRVSISVAVTVSAMHIVAVERGYWATLTCLVIMQPHGSATWAKALQRVAGTILGAAVAIVVTSFVHTPQLTVLFVFLFVSFGMALLPMNYGAFAVFLTPGFVLLAEMQSGSSGLAWVRVLNTLLGALIAVLGTRLLFPLSERDQFRPLMAEAFASLRALLGVAAASVPSPERLGAARRRVGLALLNAEASYQRMLTETGIAPEDSEAVLTLLLYAHRLASGLIALAVAEGTLAHTRLRERSYMLAVEIEQLREATLEGRAPAAPSYPEPFESEPGERVEVLFEQLSVLRAAATRWDARLATKKLGRALFGR